MELRVRGLLDELVRKLRERFGDDLVSVVLYGSVARDTATKDSDVDVLIVCRGLPPGSRDRGRLIDPLTSELEAHLDSIQRDTGWYPYLSLQIRSPEEASRTSRTYFDMIEEAVLLFDRDDFFKQVLARVAARMKELGSRKIYVDDRRYYWDLKPDLEWGEVFEI